MHVQVTICKTNYVTAHLSGPSSINRINWFYIAKQIEGLIVI